MGTRSLTFVYDDVDTPLVCLYRQFDGYPSCHGVDLAMFLNGKTIVNGFNPKQNNENFANGMDCLAAQLIAKLKTGIGNIYIIPIDSKDVGEEYVYHIYNNRVIVEGFGKQIFRGSWKKFDEFCYEAELSHG